MSEETTEIIYHVRESAYLALAAKRELLIAARSDLYAIREESTSATLRLAMLKPLERIGDAIEAMTEITRKD